MLFIAFCAISWVGLALALMRDDRGGWMVGTNMGGDALQWCSWVMQSRERGGREGGRIKEGGWVFFSSFSIDNFI